MKNRTMENTEGKPGAGLMDVLSFTAEKTCALADANGVLGEPVTVDGVTVIPVSKVSVGFAGGGADGSGRENRRTPAGAGAKVTLTPVTLLVVEDGKAHLMTVDREPNALPLDLARAAVAKLRERKEKA